MNRGLFAPAHSQHRSFHDRQTVHHQRKKIDHPSPSTRPANEESGQCRYNRSLTVAAPFRAFSEQPRTQESGQLPSCATGRSLKFVVAQQMRMLISRHLCAELPPAPNRE
jgi:hypothetical protein